MGTFRDSWALTRVSLGMVRDDPALLALPVLAGVALLGVLLVVTMPFVAWYLLAPGAAVGWAGSGGNIWVLVVLGVGVYFALVFVGNFFYAALIGAATTRLEGGRPTVGDGLAFARAHLVRILLWSVIAASVGLLIRLIASRFRGIVGIVLGTVMGASWGLVTYFALPVILYESQGPWASIQRSAGLFLHTFGRTLLSNLYVTLIAIGLGLLGVALVVVGFVIGVSGGSWALAVPFALGGGAVIIFAAVLVSALEGILVAALYRYATTGKIAADIIPYEYRVPH